MTIAELPAAAPPAVRRFTRKEYYQMFELGFFQNQRVELIDGEVIYMSPQKSPHALTIAIVTGWLVHALGTSFTVRGQLPLVASNWTEPEPDFAIIPGSPESQKEHPATALLIIEVADNSLAYDRNKAAIYAAAKVPEYWIINLQQRRLEVYRHPTVDMAADYGFAYRETFIRRANQQIKPLRLPIDTTDVSRLFPPR